MSGIVLKVSLCLLFLDPPDLVTSFPPMIRNQSDTLSINCSFTGTPLPTIRWYRDNMLIGLSDERVEFKNYNEGILAVQNLVIRDLVKSDEGTYRCTGSNGVENLIDAVDYYEAFITIHGM